MTVTEKSETWEWTSDLGNRRSTIGTETRIENKEGTTEIKKREQKINGEVWQSSTNTEFHVHQKTDAQRLEDPTNDNNARPMTAKDDPMGIIGDRDSLHERLRIINPEIDPMNEGDQTGYGSYINPALRILGTSNGGRSTGAWEEVGGAYVGPNIGAINDSLGGTSTGNDWF